MHSITLSRRHDSDFWAPSSARASVLRRRRRRCDADAGEDHSRRRRLRRCRRALGVRRPDLPRSAALNLVILDLMLADVDGRDTCREIRSRCGRSITILMVSARGRGAVVTTLEAEPTTSCQSHSRSTTLEAQRPGAVAESHPGGRWPPARGANWWRFSGCPPPSCFPESSPNGENLVLEEAQRLLDATARPCICGMQARSCSARPTRLPATVHRP